MRVENRKMEGDMKVSDELTLNGSVSGTTSVTTGGYLILNGMIGQDLVLEKDSKVELFGTVTGNVYNRGGELAIHGIVEGALYKNAGIMVIYPESKIKGKIY
jgi:cytoskeletal protein CcmA (bactofilin family)